MIRTLFNGLFYGSPNIATDQIEGRATESPIPSIEVDEPDDFDASDEEGEEVHGLGRDKDAPKAKAAGDGAGLERQRPASPSTPRGPETLGSSPESLTTQEPPIALESAPSLPRSSHSAGPSKVSPAASTNSSSSRGNQPVFKAPTALPYRQMSNGSSSNTLMAPPSVPRLKLSHGNQEDSEEELDGPPIFPLPNSAQRSHAPSPPISMRTPQILSNGRVTLAPPSSGGLAPPPSTTLKPKFGIQADPSNSNSTASTSSTKRRRKVALAPGYSPLDWARLTRSGQNLKGVEGYIKVNKEMLEQHKTSLDAWTVIDGKVYNVTRYLPFHPGGRGYLLQSAGKDGTKLFYDTHSWVNADALLSECIVGQYIGDRPL